MSWFCVGPSDALPFAVFWSPAPTFDLVGGCGPHLGLTVFHQVLEGRHQVCLGDLRPHCFLELQTESKASERAGHYSLWVNESRNTVKGTRTGVKKNVALGITAEIYSQHHRVSPGKSPNLSEPGSSKAK